MKDRGSIINNLRVQSIMISFEDFLKNCDEVRGEVPTWPSHERREISIADFILQGTYCCRSQQITVGAKLSPGQKALSSKFLFSTMEAWSWFPSCSIFASSHLRKQKVLELEVATFTSQSIQVTALATGHLSRVYVSFLISPCDLIHRLPNLLK